MANLMQTTIAVDCKKFRVRIHKVNLHTLGDPKFIQLLVNPKDRTVAIRKIEKALSCDQAHKIDPNLSPNASYEIYSRAFVKKLCELGEGVDANSTYLLTGRVIKEHDIAVFPMSTLKKVEV